MNVLQIEFFARQTEGMVGKEKTLKDLYERKCAELEGMYDKLRLENTVSQ